MEQSQTERVRTSVRYIVHQKPGLLRGKMIMQLVPFVCVAPS